MNKKLIRKMLTAAGGPIKRQKDGYRYIPDKKSKGGWLKITDDAMSDVFSTLEITPNKIRTGSSITRTLLPKSSNYRSAYNPDDIIKGFNALTLGGLNNLSPTQWVRRAYNTGKLLNGDMTWSGYTNSWINGNNGLVSLKFSEEHPYLSTGINLVGDIGIGGGALLSKTNLGQEAIARAKGALDATKYGLYDRVLGYNLYNKFLKGKTADLRSLLEDINLFSGENYIGNNLISDKSGKLFMLPTTYTRSELIGSGPSIRMGFNANNGKLSRNLVNQGKEAIDKLPAGTSISADAHGLSVPSRLATEGNREGIITTLLRGTSNTETTLSNLERKLGEDPGTFVRNPYDMSADAHRFFTIEAQKPGRQLVYAGRSGLWNNAAISNPLIYEWQEAYNAGNLSAREYVNNYNNWVKGFGGRPGHVDINGKPYFYHPTIFITHKQGGKIGQFKSGGQIRKMQTASGGPIHYSRTMTSDNLSKAANYVGNYILKGLGAFGKIMTAPFVQLGPTSSTIYKSKKLLAKEKAIELKSEELLGKAMTWVSPLNYGAALATGNGLNARKGEEEVASWSPAWQAVGRLGELYAGPKMVKGVKSAPKTIINTAAKAGVKPAKAAVIARKINKVVNETNDLSKLLAFDLFQELTSAPTSKITRLRPEFSLAMQDKNYMFGRLLWSTNLTKDGYTTPQTKHIKVMDTEQADPLVYVTQALYPLAIENGGLRAAHGGQTRPIWLNSNKPYFGTPTGVSNSTNYTYVIDANKFTPELNLLRNIGGAHYEYPGTGQLPIEGTRRILWDPVLLQYTSTIFTEAPKSEISSTASLKFFERRPSRISEAEKLGVPKGERNVKQGYLLKDAIEEANKFAEKWGYDKLSQNATLLDIENLYNQHNTFFRGVTTEQLENTRNRVAKELGINPELLTNDLYLLYVSTHPWPGNDRIWVTPFSHYGKIYGNSDMIGGKGLLSAVMRPWKTTKDIKQWPKLSLWTLGFKEDVSNPVITPWVSNAPDAIRSLGALSEFLVKSPLIYRGLGKDFKGTFLLYLKYKDGQGKLGWIESLVGELPLEIIIKKQGGKMNILEFLKNGNKIKKALLGTNLNVDTRSDTTRQGYNERRMSSVQSHNYFPLLDFYNAVEEISLTSNNPYLNTGIVYTPSRADRTWKFLHDFVKKNPRVLSNPTVVSKGMIPGNEITVGQVKQPLTGLTVRNNTPLTLENTVMNPAEKAAAEDYLASRNLKNFEEFPDVTINTKLPTGRPTGDYKYPKEIMEKYGFDKPKVTQQQLTTKPVSKTSSQRSKEYYSKKKEDKDNGVSRKRSRLVLNNKALTTGDMRAANIGRPRRAARNSDLEKELEKDNGYWGREFNKIKLKVALKKQGSEQKYKDFLDSYWNYKLKGVLSKERFGGILNFYKKGGGIHIKEKNKGKFTSYCGGKVTDECILKGKNSSNPAIRKRATFADNARHFKHRSGGLFPSLKVKKHQAFVPGASITDSNPKAYKYLKKHKYSSGGFLKDVGDFLKSNSGMLDLGKSLFSGISDYKQTSSLLDGYLNKIAANANLQYEQALMDAEIERQKTPDIFTNTTGEVINQGVETIANGWQPFSLKISAAKRKLDLLNAATDLLIRDAKGQALGNMFGTFVLNGLGTLTSILG